MATRSSRITTQTCLNVLENSNANTSGPMAKRSLNIVLRTTTKLYRKSRTGP
jgi:hypothetical protein